MNRFKQGLVILLAVLILFLCAMLPRALGKVQDSVSLGKVEQAQTAQISLTMKERSPLENLLLISGGNNGLFHVTPEEMNLSREEVTTMVGRELDPYISSGLIDRAVLSDYTEWEYEPFISVPVSAGSLTGKVWYVFLCGEDWSLNLYLADQDGRLLFVNYYCSDYFYTGDYADQEFAIEQLNIFESIYYGNLELSDDIQYIENEVMPVNPVPLKDGSVARWYGWKDETYGEISIELYFTPYGFYVSFP